MRFQQLKRDPNSVMRKKLVKSKKNWIVVSSLSLAGGLFLLGAPTTETVKAAETTAPVSETATPTSTSNTNTATGSGTDTANSTSTEKQTTPAVTASTPATETSKSTTDTTPAAKEESSEVTPAKNVSGTSENADATTKSVTDSDTDQTASDTKAAETDTPVVNADQATPDTKAVTTDAPVVNTDQTKTDTEVATDDTEKADTPATGEKTTAEQTSATGTQSTDGNSTVKTTDPAKDVSDVKTDDSAEVKDGADATKEAASDSTLKDGVISDTDVVDPKVADTIQPVSLLATNILDSENQLAKMGIMAESLAIDPEAVVLNANGNIAEGTQGTTPWKIDADGILHLGTKDSTTVTQLDDSKSKVTSTLTYTNKLIAQKDSSSGSDNEISSSTVRSTSNWIDYADSITSISIDSSVKMPINAQYMFSDLHNLKTVSGLSNLNFNNTSDDSNDATLNVEGMFANDTSLTTVDFTNTNLRSILNISRLFENDTSLTKVTYPSSADSVTGVIDASYAYANNTSLDSPNVNVWQVHALKKTTGMFKNDKNLGITPEITGTTKGLVKNLNLGGWVEYASDIDTGNSSLGQGMFDGTDLNSITLYKTMKFSKYTALTSSQGSTWVSGSHSFKGVPDFDSDGNASGGIGSLYTGTAVSTDILPLTYTATGAKAGDTVSNQVTIQTNHGPLTFVAKGTFGVNTDISSQLPTTMVSIEDGKTYNLSPDQIVKVTFGQTEANTITSNDVANDTSNTVSYVGKTVNSGTFTIPTNLGTTITIPVDSGYAGDSTSVTIPEDQIPAGYHVENKTINVTYNDDSTTPFTSDTAKIELVGNDVKGQTTTVDGPTAGSTVTVDVPDTTVGSTDVPIDPKVPGYTTTPGKATITADKDGKPVVTVTEKPTFTGNDVKGQTTTVDGPTAGSTVTVDVPDTTVGSTDVPIDPKVPGYTTTPGKATITADKDGNPVVTVTEKPTYTGNDVKGQTTTVDGPTAGSTVTVDVPDTTVGSTDVPIDPKVPGYTTTPGKATITADKDGKPVVTVTEKPTYTANSNDKASWTTDVDDLNGNPVSTSGSGNIKTGDTVNIATAPTGYTVKDGTGTATATVDDKGNVTLSHIVQPKYVPVPSKPDQKVTFTLPDGSTKDVDIPAGAFGDKDKTVTVPNVYGYDHSATLPVSYDKDGNATVDTANVYTGVKNPGTTIQVTNPDGTTSNITIPEGHYGDDPVTVTADDKPGYKSPSVVVTYNANGIPTIADANDPTTPIDATTDVLTYKRISSGSSNHVVVPDGVGKIEKKQQTVATFSDKPDVEVYALDDNNKMSVVNDRILPHQTNWMSDESITIDGVTYYRVATNEWAKADQVYAYDAGNFFIRTYDDSVKLLYAAEGNIVQNRSLARSSSWMSDRTAYIIDGQKYYRVATNEFVSAEDAYVYTPVKLNVRTTGGSYKNLYTAKGVQIQGRYINAHVALKVDSITYINGDKYYRVATNEFIKAEDVETY